MITIKKLNKDLSEGVYDNKLSYLYCRKPEQVEPFRERIRHVADGYAQTFGKGGCDEIAIYSAPGRTEIGGNHTDHQRGKVLTASVDLDALACAAPNGTNMVNICSEGYGMVSIDCTQFSPDKKEENSTAALIRGILARIAEMGYTIGGFDAYVISDVPGGSGLSSSACFEVLIGTAINGLFCGNAISMVEIAKIGQYAENVYFGKPSGLLDQMGCALGGIVAIDFKDRENPVCHVVDFNFASAGYALCMVDSGADHADLTDDYAAVPEEMGAVARLLGKEVLSEVSEACFYAAIPHIRENVGDRAVLRAVHYYNDCVRVEKQVAALENGDFDYFLSLVNASGRSSAMYLQNVYAGITPLQQEVVLSLALAEHLLKGRGAVRVHGGGFAGTIQAFVPMDMVEEFRSGMEAVLGKDRCHVLTIRPVGGTVLMK